MAYNDFYSAVIKGYMFTDSNVPMLIQPAINSCLEIIRMWATQDNETSEFMTTIEITEFSGTDISSYGTVVVPQPVGSGDNTSGTSIKANATYVDFDPTSPTSSGMAGIKLRESFSSKVGFIYLPLKGERITTCNSSDGGICVWFPDGLDQYEMWEIGIIFRELG